MINLKHIAIEFESVKVDGKIEVRKLIELLIREPTEPGRFPSSEILNCKAYNIYMSELSKYIRNGRAVK